MNIPISASLKKQIDTNRSKLAVSEAEYVRNALLHYDQLLRLNADLKTELELWEAASQVDTNAWLHKNKV